MRASWYRTTSIALSATFLFCAATLLVNAGRTGAQQEHAQNPKSLAATSTAPPNIQVVHLDVPLVRRRGGLVESLEAEFFKPHPYGPGLFVLWYQRSGMHEESRVSVKPVASFPVLIEHGVKVHVGERWFFALNIPGSASTRFSLPESPRQEDLPHCPLTSPQHTATVLAGSKKVVEGIVRSEVKILEDRMSDECLNQHCQTLQAKCNVLGGSTKMTVTKHGKHFWSGFGTVDLTCGCP